MKKYNLSKIMKRAWELVKKAGLSISEGLKKAWREAKGMQELREVFRVKEEDFEKLLDYKKNWNSSGCLSIRHDFKTGEYVLIHKRGSWPESIMKSTAQMVPLLKDFELYLEEDKA